MEHHESKHGIVRGIENAVVLALAACLWLAERIYRPLYQIMDMESLDNETLCALIDFEGGESCL